MAVPISTSRIWSRHRNWCRTPVRIVAAYRSCWCNQPLRWLLRNRIACWTTCFIRIRCLTPSWASRRSNRIFLAAKERVTASLHSGGPRIIIKATTEMSAIPRFTIRSGKILDCILIRKRMKCRRVPRSWWGRRLRVSWRWIMILGIWKAAATNH